MRTDLSILLILVTATGFAAPVLAGDPDVRPEVHFVTNGKEIAVYEQGKIWRRNYKPGQEVDGWLEVAGDADAFHQTKQLVAARAVGKGDFLIRAKLSLLNLKGGEAAFVIDNENRFIFSSRADTPYEAPSLAVVGPLFAGRVPPLVELGIKEGLPFLFEVERTGNAISFRIDGREVYTLVSNGEPFGAVGFLPWWSKIRLQEFSARGETLDLADHYRRSPEQIPLFVGGTDGYPMYKIPALLVTKKGTLLAFCEARHWASDAADIEIVLKRSLDNGKTWSKQQIIWDDGTNTCGNPCPVVDQETGAIWLTMCRNNDRVFVTRSDDDGVTWSEPVEITSSVKPRNWRWYATGPGVGIQLERGEHTGRLVIPCDHTLVEKGNPPSAIMSHAIYSDDHGETWELGGEISPSVSECQVVELVDASLMMNMRSYHRKSQRAVATSVDGGETWSRLWHDPALVEPVCEASILRYSTADKQGKDRLLFSNPPRTERIRLTVRVSYDEGKTWPVSKLLYSGPSGYSSLAVLPDGTIGCLFEAGLRHWNENLYFSRFSLEWLTDGKDGIATR